MLGLKSMIINPLLKTSIIELQA